VAGLDEFGSEEPLAAFHQLEPESLSLGKAVDSGLHDDGALLQGTWNRCAIIESHFVLSIGSHHICAARGEYLGRALGAKS